jgi:flagellar biosynthesis protein FlhF
VPPETFAGSDLSSLFAQARANLGPDAVMLDLKRAGLGRAARFTLTACGPADAPAPGRRSARPRPAPGTAIVGSSAGMAPRRPGGPGRSGTQPVVVALVGPTGAGKTTTIAKLANHPKVFGGWSVGMLSLDTYRIGAVEQSRIYAELSGLPFEFAYEEDDVEEALRRLGHREAVLVDTAGRSPRRAQDLTATRRQLKRLGPDEVHLVLPAGLQAAHARRLLEEHRPLGVTHLLVTKLDECPDDSTVFALAAENGLPMRWAATGQEVPGDLAPAADAPARVAEPAGMS